MALIQIGLVDKTKKISPTLMHEAAAALNVQVVQDLPQHWPISATVQYLPSTTHIPAGVWPVFLVAKLPPGEGGFHMDKHNQPYAEVIASPTSEEWTIDASHEILEMLVDPYGNRMQSSLSIKIQGNSVVDDDAQFNYLVESADPCEADNYGYSIQGIQVSDFITPHFYDRVSAVGVKYSFTGAITRPRGILPGGYISYVNLETDQWEQILWVDPNSAPQLRQLGPAGNAKSLRMWIDGQMANLHPDRASRSAANASAAAANQAKRANLAKIAALRGSLYGS